MPIVIPNTIPSGTLVYQWIDPQGVTRNISGSGTVNVLAGEQGLGMPGVDLAEDKLPYAPGSYVRHAAIGPRDIALPVLFGPVVSPAALDALMDSVYGWFATADEQSQTPGFLRVTRPDGTQRQIACYYVGGLDGDLTSSRSGDVWQRSEIILRAADPWATDIADTEYAWGEDDLPDVAAMNLGQLDAFPVIEVVGPFGSVTAENTTTGRSWELLVGLLSGRTLIVDARPAYQRPGLAAYTTDTFTNLFQYFDPASDLWTLAEGANALSFTFTGTGDQAPTSETAINMTFRQRYRGLRR